MIGLLGERAITLLRYPAPAYAGEGWYVPGTPTTTEIRGSVDPSPRTRERQTPGGKTSTVDVEVVSYSEIRAASDTQQTTADRLVIDGRTYEVAIVDRSPPFLGQPESWVAYCTEVQPLVSEVTTPTAPVNLQPPAINIDGATLTAWPGLWSGTPPIAFAYSWEVDGVEVSTGTSITQPDEGTVVLTVIASNGVGVDGVAESPPLGGGGVVDCAVTCADAIQDAVDAATAPLEAQIVTLTAERDAVQALYDAALITIAARDATIAALELEITGLEAQIVTLTAERDAALAAIPVAFADGAASIQSEWRSYAYTAPSITRDPSGLLSGTPTRSGGVVSATLNAGIVATSVQAGAALVWPVTDAQGRALQHLNGVTGFLRVVCPTLPAVGTGIRIAVAVMTSDNPATAQGLAIGIIPHATSGYLGTVINGVSGVWTVTAAGAALTGTVRGAAGGWARFPGGTSNVYRNLTCAPFNASGVPSGATTTGASATAPKVEASFQITHVALVFMTTLSLASATAVQASPQAALLDVDHADLTGVTP